MSLKDKRIVVTRAPHQAAKLVKMLQDKEAVPLIYPCIDIAPPEDSSELDSALRNLKAYDWLVLTSSNTVLAICRRMGALQLQMNWTKIKIAAVGTSTASSIEALFGMKPTFVPKEHTAEALAQALPIYEDMRVFLPQSDIAGMDIVEILKNRGVDITVVSAYGNVVGQGGEDIPLRLQENRLDAITFTSGSTVEGFVHRIEPLTAYDLPAACIGTSTAEVAQSYGFQNIIVPEKFTLKDMIVALENHFAKPPSRWGRGRK
jgi:uroporphyrinogen-III synthase